MQIRFGTDVFSGQAGEYKGRRLGLVSNDAATTASGKPSRQALLSAGYKLVRLFSPEHGLDRSGEDGQEMPSGKDALTRLPVVSLYGDKLAPAAEDLADLDMLLFDLPDIGCRFYTYLWTLSHVMEACHRHRKPLIVLDRPNPLSGNLALAEGPLLDVVHCASFIGRWAIPLRYSCTFGELARYWQASRLPGLDLRVIGVEGWDRNSFHKDWGIPFVPTSPAMTTAEAAMLYPGLGLLEATNLSEGRGTNASFCMAGAPWMDNIRVCKLFDEPGLPVVKAEPVDFVPESGKYAQESCRGVRFRLTDDSTSHAPSSSELSAPALSAFRPVRSAMLFIKLVKDLHAPQKGQHTDAFAWSPYPTHVNPSGASHLDLLLGLPDAEAFFEQPWDEFVRALPSLLSCGNWEETMRPWLLY
ncbi:MAG TPA: DUF1343 domain-containing protein [Puia sp.]|nr:DUF1343 domain-containing protein [Puia sp.]